MCKILIIVAVGLTIILGVEPVGAGGIEQADRPAAVRKLGSEKAGLKARVTGEFRLVMSKDDDVCQHMLKIFNEDLRESGNVEFDRHKEFNVIRWENKRRYVINENGAKDYESSPGTDSYSVFDVNNDKKNEVVLWARDRGLKGIPSDDIFIFKIQNESDFQDGVNDGAQQYVKAIVILGGALGRQPFSSNTYELKEIPPIKVLPKLGEEKNVKVYHFLEGGSILIRFSTKESTM